MSVPYLIQLGERIATGLQRLPADFIDRHAAFFLSRQTEHGGFSGRDVDLNGNPLFEDGSQADLYYTSFAMRGLHSLGRLDAATGTRISDFLKSPSGQPRSLVDLISWLSSVFMLQAATGMDLMEGADPGWTANLAAQFERCRTSDGGYAKSPAGASGSTYHSFLVVCCYELIGQTVPEPEWLVQFLLERQRDDGGFVEIAPMRRSGTNPTAAAVAVLKILGSLDQQLISGVAEFLEEVRSDDGGFQANTRIPFSDALSTFTAVVTALDMERPDLIQTFRIQRLLREMEGPVGGYLAAAWDHAPDVEYSFYGVGTLGLLQSISQQS